MPTSSSLPGISSRAIAKASGTAKSVVVSVASKPMVSVLATLAR